ncbi:MAG: peptide deformylase [Candidatus Omnitrophica bacterium 4484_70.2]|nr:MAG: peptide deformylase [Candidatus Omnitrophica bacterium 4484_70.2]
MQVLEIKKYPDKVLRKKCEEIEGISSYEKDLFSKMLFTMRRFQGIGLAAPQVGILKRLIVVDIGEGEIKLANPKILEVKGEDKLVEGCLSIPGAQVEVKRAYEVVVEGLNEKDKLIQIKAKGLLARVLQHEIDHLDGKLIIDYLPFWRKWKFRTSS